MSLYESLNTPQEEISVGLFAIGNTQELTFTSGSTVADFRQESGLDSNVRLCLHDGTILSDSTVLEDGMQIFVSTAKENGYLVTIV